jgi:hypothetical protein
MVFHIVQRIIHSIAQCLRPRRFEAVHVKRDAIMLLRLQSQYFGRDMLERPQQLCVFRQQQLSVRPLALDVDLPPLQFVRISCARSRRKWPFVVSRRINDAIRSAARARSSMEIEAFLLNEWQWTNRRGGLA